jgi:hypothetical protein
MKTRKVITSLISVLMIAALFYFLWDLYRPLTTLLNRLELNTRHYLLSIGINLMIALICFLSMRNWFEFFLRGGIRIKLIPLILGLAALIIGAIPAVVWVMSSFGRPGGNVTMLLATPAIHHVISAAAGVLIGRSFGHKSDASSTKSAGDTA